MAEAKVRVGGNVVIIDKNNEVRVVARVYTDAVDASGNTPHKDLFDKGCEEAIERTKEREVGGIVLVPWENDPLA